ncbi:hypothetical protein [Streptomyces sp. NPDC020983]|uniref:hypothetical protein n=1 Tax=Streptomyces sp. NPDC020983 TaxID=3365106 RepID=UPI0037B87A7E
MGIFSRLRRPGSRRVLSDLVDVAGLGCLDAAAWWLWPPAGLIVLGGMLLLVGWVMDR